MASKITGTDITITDQPSQGRQFIAGLGQSIAQGIDNIPEAQKAKRRKQAEKIELYASLRDQGFSKEEASEKVDQSFEGNFFDKIVGGNKKFQAPSGPDKQDRKEAASKIAAQKEIAGIAKTQAETLTESEKTKKTTAEVNSLRAKTQATLRETEAGKAVYTVDQNGNLKKRGEVGKNDKVVEIDKKSEEVPVGELRKIIADPEQPKEIRQAAEQRMAEILAKSLGVNPKAIKKKGIENPLAKLAKALADIGLSGAAEQIVNDILNPSEKSETAGDQRITMRKPDGSMVGVAAKDVDRARELGYEEA